ncbi:MAG TPA: hypothetical protein VFQ91_04155 [Bryobacteraceae bacterium]|nr:hypothetical protein [Bryobacteraceae bacterium]
MEIQFTGFSHNGRFREFAFDCVVDLRHTTRYKVVADLELSRKYEIPVQELPLLCRRLVEEAHFEESPSPLTFTEADMRTWRNARKAQREQIVHKKPQRRTKSPSSTWHLPLRYA